MRRLAVISVILAAACSHGPPADFVPDPGLVSHIRSIELTAPPHACPGQGFAVYCTANPCPGQACGGAVSAIERMRLTRPGSGTKSAGGPCEQAAARITEMTARRRIGSQGDGRYNIRAVMASAYRLNSSCLHRGGCSSIG